ncbi:hypothetical protein AB0I72_20035 [Nocardiopsis sp. NPDC049922]|uniref:hypothetical protein n=1 Tax=Nocardiopsis sp. NPDC049922 TaxID=3155157 RepID=UPI0033DC2BDD
MAARSSQRPPQRKSPVRPKDVFDLDALEKDGEVQPFGVRLGGKVFVISDPMDEDWQDAVLIDMNDIEGSLRPLLGDQYEDFKKIRMPMWKMKALNDAMEAHYSRFYGTRGEGSASSGS